ncbi:pyridoxamine 5'-phosphate oxidase family protein [Streptomyces sp. STR69]|uniref:pyridoxamine 5'-phosphate oxidase family protein n=1 Tax=Streptomyces sp. STR69 TaxID=1796942 RepID=UPI002905971A|nr:pyridoxamine 5'-phosphate oxidase family protein [Streptomyces sp. STR69]
MSHDEALKLLGSVRLGRVAFTDRALPAIRPVSHVMDEGDFIVRTQGGSALSNRAPASEVAAYEADEIDPTTRTGWSVVVTGTATRVADAGDLARYERLPTPWIDTETGQVVRIRPEIVSDPARTSCAGNVTSRRGPFCRCGGCGAKCPALACAGLLCRPFRRDTPDRTLTGRCPRTTS